MQEDLADMAGWEAVEASEDGIELIMLMDHAMRQQLTKTIVGCTTASGKAMRAAKDNNKAACAATKDKAAHAAVNKKMACATADKKAVREAKEMARGAADQKSSA